MYQRAEEGFDKLFGYNRQLPESFEYANTMKNGSIYNKLKMQKQELKQPTRLFTGKNRSEFIQSDKKENNISYYVENMRFNNQSYNQINDINSYSLFSIIPLRNDSNFDKTLMEELQNKKLKKKKGIRR